MGWFGEKGLSDKKRGAIALMLLRKTMLKDGLGLDSEQRDILLQKAATKGLKTKKEVLDWVMEYLKTDESDELAKDGEKYPSANEPMETLLIPGFTQKESQMFLEEICRDLIEESLFGNIDNNS